MKFDPDKKTTNFEKIKAMNIDEMAKFLCEIVEDEGCEGCLVKGDEAECAAAIEGWKESLVRECSSDNVVASLTSYQDERCINCFFNDGDCPRTPDGFRRIYGYDCFIPRKPDKGN